MRRIVLQLRQQWHDVRDRLFRISIITIRCVLSENILSQIELHQFSGDNCQQYLHVCVILADCIGKSIQCIDESKMATVLPYSSGRGGAKDSRKNPF